MQDRGFTIKQLAESVAAKPANVADEANRITRIRRKDKKSILLRQEDAVRYAAALEVPVNRLLAGELTSEEKKSSGGCKAKSAAPKAGKSKLEKRTAVLKTRKKLAADRFTALTTALCGRGHAALHSQLEAAGKLQWTTAMVKSYVRGTRFPNKDFLTDVAELLGVDLKTLTIRESPLENLGRRPATVTPVVTPAVLSALNADTGIPVRVFCNELLGVKHEDRIVFDAPTRSFRGQNVELVPNKGGFDLVVRIPVTGDISKKLLGLVTQ
jgi:hypothetical protein